MSLRKAADIAHKTVVTGLFGLFGYGLVKIGSQLTESKKGGEQPQAGFIEMLRNKADEEYKKRFDTGHREWYSKDDDSYLKQIPRPEEYSPKTEK